MPNIPPTLSQQIAGPENKPVIGWMPSYPNDLSDKAADPIKDVLAIMAREVKVRRT